MKEQYLSLMHDAYSKLCIINLTVEIIFIPAEKLQETGPLVMIDIL